MVVVTICPAARGRLTAEPAARSLDPREETEARVREERPALGDAHVCPQEAPRPRRSTTSSGSRGCSNALLKRLRSSRKEVQKLQGR